MKRLSIKNWPAARLLFPGLIFLVVNTSTSYAFYHVNSFKIVLMVLGISVFAIRNIPPLPSIASNTIPWKIWLILSVPVVATIPGLILHRGGTNYNLSYELVTSLVLFLWVVYLCRSVSHETDIGILLIFIGLVVIFNGAWSILEKSGFHPLAWGESVKFTKATFGHRNYFSGFLITLLPTILVFAIPDGLFKPDAESDLQTDPPVPYRFYLTVFTVGCLSLVLAQTRAAIAAFGVALALVCFIYVHFFTDRQWRRRVLMTYSIVFLIGVSLAVAILLFPDLFRGNRFAQLFSVKAWLGRKLAWETAIDSIKASPLAGYGLGSSYNLFFSFVDPGARLFHHEHSYNHAHSEILEYIQEGGIIGLISFIAFWAWLIRRLVRLMRRPDVSPTALKLLIGICGGFTAFHIHGSFSVAPRMMVTRLPIFTLIAFLLILDHQYGSRLYSDQGDNSLRSRLKSGLPTFVVLTLVWVMFFPWAAAQWQFNRIRQERPSYLQIQKLERLTRIVPDIYALDYLSSRQIEYKQFKGLAQTLKTTELVIPHYRNLGYKKSLYAILKGDRELAKRLGRSFQQHDRYYQPAIDLMLVLAIRTDDFSLFKEQFALSLRRHIFNQGVVESLNENDVMIQFLPQERLLNIVDDSGKLTFQWGEKVVGLLFQAARANHNGIKISSTDRFRYLVNLKKIFNAQPWSQLKIFDPYTTERQMLLGIAKAHQHLQVAWQEHKAKLEKGYRKELDRTPTGLRKGVYNVQQKALDKVRQSYQKRSNRYEEQLRHKTDWNDYSRKQKLMAAFSERLITVIFSKDA